MSNFTDFIGGGGSASFPTIFLSKSQTWVPPQDGNIMIHVIGAGGGGAGATSNTTNSGSAGGYCKKNTLAVTTSGSFTVVIGSDGSRGRNNGSGGSGGTSSVAGTGLSSTLTATGGDGGSQSGTVNPSAGVGSNGDVNTTGGEGGYYRGGGAVGLTGTGEAGFRDGANGWAGECDIVGDLWSSTLGQIAGGRRGVSVTTSAGSASKPSPIGNCNGEPFSGGGGVRVQSNPNPSSLAQGGDGGIGAGGGFGINTDTTAYCNGGSGGPGIVVIQYIP